MALCRCGVNGGKHLFKDCPKAKEKSDKKALAAALAANASTANGLTEEQLRAALAALNAEAESSSDK